MASLWKTYTPVAMATVKIILQATERATEMWRILSYCSQILDGREKLATWHDDRNIDHVTALTQAQLCVMPLKSSTFLIVRNVFCLKAFNWNGARNIYLFYLLKVTPDE